jgi:pimeloyl-ACP methyl ester carboxylesterase
VHPRSGADASSQQRLDRRHGRDRRDALPNPLRGLAADSAYIASVLGRIDGPVLLVGHSYGGAVTTNAATAAPNVLGLVYVAAFAPDEGERLGVVATGSKDSVLDGALVPRRYPTGQAGEEATPRQRVEESAGQAIARTP